MNRVGDTLQDKYRLTALLGEGGMGQVFEATHLELHKKVAIKILHPHAASEDDCVARFRREARATAAIGHPGIIDVYDIGLDDEGGLFLVMELLPGCSLAQLLEQTPRLEEKTTTLIACQILAALDAVHEQGIIHRDLKPENIFIVDGPRQLPEVKILDFGISMITAGALDLQDRITKTGAVLGTPMYMSPEQACGQRDLDQRVDLFSLGVILYQCITGELPFVGANYNELIVNILTVEPMPPEAFVDNVSPELNGVILQAMAKEIGDRFATAREMLDELVPLLDDHHVAQLAIRDLSWKEGGKPRASTGEPKGAPSQQATSLANPEPLGRSRLRVGLWVLVVVLLVSSGVLAAVVASSLSPPPQSRHPSAVKVPAEDTPPRPLDASARDDADTGGVGASERSTTVEVVLSATPSHAKIYIDGDLSRSNPFKGRFQRDGVVHRVRFVAKGYQAHQAVVSFDHNPSLHIDLERLEKRPTEGVLNKSRPEKRDAGGRREDPWRQ